MVKIILKILIKLVIFICILALLFLGYKFPDFVIRYTDSKANYIDIRELPDFSLDLINELSYEEKFLLANSCDFVSFDTSKTISSEEDVKIRVKKLIEKMIFNFNNIYYNTDINIEWIKPRIYMRSEKIKAVVWNISIDDLGNHFEFVFDDGTLDLLSFSYYNKTEYKFDNILDMEKMALFFLGELNSDKIKYGGDENDNDADNFIIDIYVNYNTGYYTALEGSLASNSFWIIGINDTPDNAESEEDNSPKELGSTENPAEEIE